MFSPATTDCCPLDDARQAWDRLSKCVTAFASAWEQR
jgi:hypothetical protein